MRITNNIRRILIITPISLLLATVCFLNSVFSEETLGQLQKIQDIKARRASKTQDGINFCLTVIPGDQTQKTIALMSITNMSDKKEIVPIPLVMPLAGTLGYKNTIQIKNEKGELLKMTGLHLDGFEKPTFPLNVSPSNSREMNLHSKTWCFELEDNFPDLAEPGNYTIEFRLISEESSYNKSTWKGTADLSVSINKSGPYKIEPQKGN